MSNKTELINLYTHKIATTDRPCFVCNKYTTSVLRSDDGLDWFYTCESHLNDRGFATPIPEPEPKPSVVQSPAKAKVSQKDDSLKSKSDSDSSQEPKDITKEEDKRQEEKEERNKEEDKIKEQRKEKQQAATPKPPQPTKPKQYILHSNIFYLREDNLNKKRQKVEAQKILSKLPNVPKTSLQ